MFKPVKMPEGLFADGGIRANMPTELAREVDADIVIAVLVDALSNGHDFRVVFRSLLLHRSTCPSSASRYKSTWK